MGLGNWKRVGDWVHIEYGKNSFQNVNAPLPTDYSRTYMPGYDKGDWLTLKADKEIYTIIQITNISTENRVQGSFYRYENGKDELFIYYTTVQVKEEPEVVDHQGLKRMLRWELDRWHGSCITYSELLKDYRPLTDTEKLLYAKED